MSPRKPVRVALVSLGCPKNLVDSEKMLALLAESGCLVGAPMAEADVIVVNTCAFLSAAREESLGVLREALERKSEGRARRVVVAGCLATRDGRGLFDVLPGLDAAVGVNDREAIVSAVLGEGPFFRGRAHRSGIASDAGRFRLTPTHTAYLRIAEGCSRRCAFCTIPAIRGPFRSKPPSAVLREARELVESGALELNLIAQDTTSYGADLRGRRGASLAWLLRRLDGLEGPRWVRLLYAYPHRFGEDLIGAIAECGKVVKYVDVPLQHISDPVLKAMRRAVRRGQIEALLGRLRDRVPGIVVRTTFLVGFPGETERQFEELLDFVREFRFDALGVFAFSPEPGTPAADMPRQVPPAVKAERARRIMLLQRRIAQTACRRRVGQTIEVLVDGADSRGRPFGRHAGQAPEIDSVCLLTRPRPAGTMVRCLVTGTKGYDLVVRPL